MIAGNFNKHFIKKNGYLDGKKIKHRIIHSVNEQMLEQAYPKRRNMLVILNPQKNANQCINIPVRMDIDRTMMVMVRVLEREPFYTAGENMN